MKKIMFNDRYGLTKAVLEGRKTMTRRIMTMDQRKRPTYQVGEEIAIAQSYHMLNKSGFVAPEWIEHTCEDSAGYKNKMFVRADLMPYRIVIRKIDKQRLQSISEDDCMREGVEKWIDCYIVTGIMDKGGRNNLCFDTPQDAFAALIDRISGKGTWESNPWVYVYSFELLKEN